MIGVAAALFPARLAVAVRQRSRHDRGRHALSAGRRPVLWPVRPRHGASISPRRAPAGCSGRWLANLTRLVIAAAGGGLALRLGGNLDQVFLALAAALAAFGLINAATVRSTFRRAARA